MAWALWSRFCPLKRGTLKKRHPFVQLVSCLYSSRGEINVVKPHSGEAQIVSCLQTDNQGVVLSRLPALDMNGIAFQTWLA